MRILHNDDIIYHEFSVSEAAKYLGVGRKVIYQLMEFGELKAVREKGRIIIDPCSLQDYRASGKIP